MTPRTPTKHCKWCDKPTISYLGECPACIRAKTAMTPLPRAAIERLTRDIFGPAEGRKESDWSIS